MPTSSATAWSHNRLAVRHAASGPRAQAGGHLGGYRQDGSYPDVLASVQEITLDAFAGTLIEDAYRSAAMNPSDLRALIDEATVLVTTDFAWSEADFSAIAALTLRSRISLLK